MLGTIEVLGGIGVILPPLMHTAPSLAAYAALGLVIVQLGAVVTHLIRHEPRALPMNLVLAALAGAAMLLGFTNFS